MVQKKRAALWLILSIQGPIRDDDDMGPRPIFFTAGGYSIPHTLFSPGSLFQSLGNSNKIKKKKKQDFG
jgi:hypothetical protein